MCNHTEAIPQSYIRLWSEATGTQALALRNSMAISA